VQRQIIYLIVVFAILLAVNYFFYTNDVVKNQGVQASSSSNFLQQSNISLTALSSDKGSTDIIRKVILRDNKNTILNASQHQGQWLAILDKNKAGIPIQTAPLAKLVRDITNAKVVENKSAVAKNHARLGLLDINDPASTSILLQLETEAQSLDVLLGNTAKLNNNQFVRLANNNQMLMIDAIIDLPASEFAWLDQTILHVNTNQISSIERKSATNKRTSSWLLQNQAHSQDTLLSEETTAYSKDANNKANSNLTISEFVLSDLNDTEQLAYPLVIENYVSTITALNYDSLLAKDGQQANNFILAATFQMNMHNETVLSMEILEKPEEQTSQKQVKPDTSLTTPTKIYAVKIVAANKSDYFNDWLFVVPNYQVEGILKDRSDFVKTTSDD
jgi:hypothetical protein